MLTFLLGMVVDIASGATATRLAAAEAFETPPRNPKARRWAAIALSLFLLASAMMLTAALVDWFTGQRFLSECFGWTGIACLQLCVVFGLRYAVANREEVLSSKQDLPGTGSHLLERTGGGCPSRGV